MMTTSMMLAGESNGKTLESSIILTDHMHFNGQNQHAKIQSLSVWLEQIETRRSWSRKY